MQHMNETTQMKALDNICHLCKLQDLCSSYILSASEQKRFSDVIIHDERRVRGEHLFFPGNQPDYIYIVHSGSFKLYITNEKGDTQITGFYFQGDVLDLNTPNHQDKNYGAVALETSTVCKIPLTEFEEVVCQYPALSNVFLKIMSREITHKQKMMLTMSKMTAEQRVADFLVHMSVESRSQGYSSAVFKLSMMRSDIANYLGLAVETVSRIFKGFQDKGIIRTEPHKVSIDNFEGLKSLAQCDYADLKAVAISQ